MKKKLISWGIVILFFTLLGSWLFVTGQEHIVIINNDYTQTKEITYTVNELSAKKLKSKKKASVKVKGISHKINIKYNINDKLEEQEKNFKINIFETITINVADLLENKESWIERKKR